MLSSSFAPGMLVELPDRRGLASVVAVDDDRCRVSLFHSIARVEPEEVPVSSLTRALIGPETRVYVSTNSGWLVGRIKDFDAAAHPFIEYVVRFPNGRTADIPENKLRVRVYEPHADPADVLANGGGESQFFHDRRWAALATSVRLRAAAQGLTAALSSRIELAPHQLAAARRVLTDPVPRYLLADEVGMGKTIEAGIVARQCLIDDPSRRVEVVCPKALVEQWHTELQQRCGLDEFAAGVTVRPFEELDTIHPGADLLIVDEVHNLLADPTRRETLTHLAHEAPRLLLLSATPALGAPQDLLDLLHLLDPAAYGPSDLAKLQARLELGRDLGRILITLTDDSPPFLVQRSLQDLAARLPEDPIVAEVAASFGGDAQRQDVVRDLRQHLADTYRVHQRVIRARRQDAPLYFQPRGTLQDGRRDHLREEVDEDLRWPELLVGVEDLRDQLREESEESASAARVLIDVLSALGAGEHIPSEIHPPASLRTALDSDAGDRTWVHVAADAIASLLRRIEQDGERAPKVVAFGSNTRRLEELAAELTAAGDEPVAIISGLSTKEIQARVHRFKAEATHRILLCDRSAEEGLNLSFADGLLHLDLPFSVTRMEQRIGRLDRFGRTKRHLRQRVLLPSDEDISPWAAWLEVLRDGFGIFERSTSDIQFVLPELERDLWEAHLERGADGLRSMSADVQDRLSNARRAADEQHALDAVALSDDGVALVEAIEDAEADEPSLQAEVEPWLVETLQLRRGPPEPDQVHYRWTRDTLIPRQPWEREFGDLDRPATWRRRVALRRNIPLIRPGARLLDAMERHLRWDDRGSAFATWRVDPYLDGDDIAWVGFRLCFVVEPMLAQGLAVFHQVDGDGLTRRAQSFLPPWTVELHVDGDGEPPPASLLPVLRRPYSRDARPEGGRDLNLCSRPELLHRAIGPGAFAKLCFQVRDRAAEAVRTDPDVASRIEEARKSADADLRRCRRRLGGDGVVAAEMVAAAVSTPRVRLDSMGFFVLSRTPPTRPM